jgi:hypothetical protein
MSLIGTNATYGRAQTNVRSWESNGLNADVAFGPFMTDGVEKVSKMKLWN